jgi:hypothetical protein
MVRMALTISIGIAFLVQVAARALTDQVHRVVLFGVAAQDQDAHVRRLGADHGQRVDAALSRHRKVHDQHVQFRGAHQFDGLAPAGCFTRHAQVHVLGEELPEARSHDGVVVHNSNFDHLLLSSLCCAHEGRNMPVPDCCQLFTNLRCKQL